MQRKLSPLPNVDYLSADLKSPLARLNFDITNIPFEDDSFDVIIASHVLEHVEQDLTAMVELFRVLKSGGWAILQVPIFGKETDEDLSLVSPQERERRFGAADHVRRYGLADYQNRLEKVGFRVNINYYADELGDKTTERCGLDPAEPVIHCEKRGNLVR